jgi:hypothetical protein
MPEFTASGLGRESNTVEIALDAPENANGMLYALGGSGGGLTLYMENGHLVYLYNMMIIEQYTARSAEPIPAGKHSIKVITKIEGPGKPGYVSKPTLECRSFPSRYFVAGDSRSGPLAEVREAARPHAVKQVPRCRPALNTRTRCSLWIGIAFRIARTNRASSASFKNKCGQNTFNATLCPVIVSNARKIAPARADATIDCTS